MKITIIDDNYDFSDKILTNLDKLGYEIEHFPSVYQAIDESKSDIYLLATSFSEVECAAFIEKFKYKIIILMANTYSYSSVRYPLDMGAKDYIVKPFRMEELERKIDYFRLKTSMDSYQSYVRYHLKNIDVTKKYLKRLNPPVIIHTNYTLFIDKLVMEYCQNKNKIFSFISLSSPDWKLKITDAGFSHFIYISNLQLLNKNDIDILFKLLKNRKFIISTTETIETDHKVIKIDSDMQLYDGSYIMSIEKYIQFIIKNFQYKISDTELAKQLEFSRKTLYDRRNKYHIYKIKKGRIAS